MAEEKQKALIELLRGHKVYLQTHNFPDPECIWLEAISGILWNYIDHLLCRQY